MNETSKERQEKLFALRNETKTKHIHFFHLFIYKKYLKLIEFIFMQLFKLEPERKLKRLYLRAMIKLGRREKT